MKTTSRRVITTLFILVYCIVVPVEAVNLNEDIHISDGVSVSVIKAVEIEPQHENNIPPLFEVVLAIIMTGVIIYFLHYFKIPSSEIPIWNPIKSPVKKHQCYKSSCIPLMPRKFHCGVVD